MLFLLAAAVTPAQAAPKTSIPSIASIAGVKVGFSSMDELERRLGKGKVTTGGHSNGARLWRVKGTSWVIYADAFDYSKRGAVVDTLQISLDPKSDRDVPYARLSRKDLGLKSGISLGIDQETLLKGLERNAWTASQVPDGWQVKAPGYSPLTSIDSFHEWSASFEVKDKALVGITLDARQRNSK